MIGELETKIESMGGAEDATQVIENTGQLPEEVQLSDVTDFMGVDDKRQRPSSSMSEEELEAKRKEEDYLIFGYSEEEEELEEKDEL